MAGYLVLPASDAGTAKASGRTIKVSGAITIGQLPGLFNSVLKPLKLKASQAPFGHGAVHQAGAFSLYDSYHCSRYNTNTGVLTPKMFREVFARVRKDLG